MACLVFTGKHYHYGQWKIHRADRLTLGQTLPLQILKISPSQGPIIAVPVYTKYWADVVYMLYKCFVCTCIAYSRALGTLPHQVRPSNHRSAGSRQLDGWRCALSNVTRVGNTFCYLFCTYMWAENIHVTPATLSRSIGCKCLTQVRMSAMLTKENTNYIHSDHTLCWFTLPRNN